ncbi:uncharacterized protein WCC33_012822 [Rhinophrynus dorsalis]
MYLKGLILSVLLLSLITGGRSQVMGGAHGKGKPAEDYPTENEDSNGQPEPTKGDCKGKENSSVKPGPIESDDKGKEVTSGKPVPTESGGKGKEVPSGKPAPVESGGKGKEVPSGKPVPTESGGKGKEVPSGKPVPTESGGKGNEVPIRQPVPIGSGGIRGNEVPIRQPVPIGSGGIRGSEVPFGQPFPIGSGGNIGDGGSGNLAGGSTGQYVLSVPALLKSGETERVCVTLQGYTQSLDLNVVLGHLGANTTIFNEDVASYPYHECHEFTVPTVDKNVPVFVTISASGGGQLILDRKSVVIAPVKNISFIQMDKPIYKAGQKLQFRLISMNSQLRPINVKYKTVYLEDPSRSRIAQWNDVESERGVAQLEFQLISDAAPGSYVITAEEESGQQHSEWTTVEEYGASY